MTPPTAAPMKAKSRLPAKSSTSPHSTVVPPTAEVKIHDHVSQHTIKATSPIESKRPPSLFLHFVTTRASYLPLLLFAGLSYWGCFYVLTTIEPAQIADIFFYHSYFPLLVIFSLATFFLSNFFLLNSRRALIFSLAVTLVVFLKLQLVIVTLPVLLISILFVLICESIFSFIFR